ncbi:ATP-binding cassette domain-containing protein [Corynebacterium striatum]|uniref:ATP-binding cassette domain-containing protein n=1 Tax=Corynebacterium striatum TaxID=43770 RepID=UPI003B632863
MITGLIGVNGSGKTTYLKQLHRNSGGGFLPDYPNIPLELSAVELLWRVGAMRNIADPKGRAEELCSALLIDGAFDRNISTYSAGNYKKTALATLLMERPEWLYLDEPLETVDVVSQEIIFDILKGLSEAGTHVVLSTQDIQLSLRLEEVKVFSQLKVVAEGAPVDVLGEYPFKRFLELSGIVLKPRRIEWLS